MSRSRQLSDVMCSWGEFALYFCAMGVLGVAALSMGGVLTTTIAISASNYEDPDAPRPLSRVEKQLAARFDAKFKKRPAPNRVVVAMKAPPMRAVALAAAMDRTETASAAEFPVEHAALETAAIEGNVPALVAMNNPSVAQTSTVMTFSALAYSAPTTAPLVAGVACSAAGCTETETQPIVEAMAMPLPESWPKPSTLGKGKPARIANAPRSSALSTLPKYAGVPAVGMTALAPSIFAQPSFTSVPPIRLADTPGDIIRRSLRGTI